MKKRNRDYTVPRHTNDSRIAQARLAKGWTQAQLAEAVGVAKQHISRWEKGSIKPSVAALVKIANALGVDLMTLIDIGDKSE